MTANSSKSPRAKADPARRSDSIRAGRLNMGPDEATIDRWVERGFVPALGRGATRPFTGFPAIVETELPPVSVEPVDD
jgi:hypothetical protein